LQGTSIALTGNVTAGTTATLTATAGDNIRKGHVSTAATLTGPTSGSTTLGQGGNDVGTLSGFSANGGSLTYADTNALTASNDAATFTLSVTAGGALNALALHDALPICLQGTSIALTGNVTAGTTATLTATAGD